jgi:hypothetical protein
MRQSGDFVISVTTSEATMRYFKILLLVTLILLISFKSEANELQIPPRFSADDSHALVSSQEAILYSLDPTPPAFLEISPGKTETFHGWRVLGKIKLTGNLARIAALSFDEALDPEEKNAHSPGYHPMIYKCVIEPRHGLKIEAYGHKYDFVLCYHCGQMVMYRDGQETEYLADHGSAQALDKILSDAHIPLPPPSKN